MVMRCGAGYNDGAAVCLVKWDDYGQLRTTSIIMLHEGFDGSPILDVVVC